MRCLAKPRPSHPHFGVGHGAVLTQQHPWPQLRRRLEVNLLGLCHFAATFALIGLVWTVQLAIYPLMVEVQPARFAQYHQRYTQAMGWVAGPLMLVELGTALALLLRHEGNPALLYSLLPLGLVWLSTALLQVPQHRRLELQGPDAVTLRALALGNWWRTLAWSSRGLLLLFPLS